MFSITEINYFLVLFLSNFVCPLISQNNRITDLFDPFSVYTIRHMVIHSDFDPDIGPFYIGDIALISVSSLQNIMMCMQIQWNTQNLFIV